MTANIHASIASFRSVMLVELVHFLVIHKTQMFDKLQETELISEKYLNLLSVF